MRLLNRDELKRDIQLEVDKIDQEQTNDLDNNKDRFKSLAPYRNGQFKAFRFVMELLDKKIGKENKEL